MTPDLRKERIMLVLLSAGIRKETRPPVWRIATVWEVEKKGYYFIYNNKKSLY